MDSNAMDVEDIADFPITEDLLKKVCKEGSKSFFSEHGLISHQINSYNDFIDNGIQKIFDSFGEIRIQSEPSIDGKLRGATMKFGKVTLEKPMFCSGDKSLKLLPRHARLQHMTYCSPINVEVDFLIYTIGKEKKDQLSSVAEQQFVKKVVSETKKNIVIGQMPVMVMSKLCWMNGVAKQDSEFDQGGYFLIKGIEKIFIAQEQLSLKRLWVSDYPNWHILYRAELKRVKVHIEGPRPDKVFLSVFFMSCSIPLWLLLYALGMPTDKRIVEMIDINMEDCNTVNILINSITYADDHFQGFRKGDYSLNKIDELLKSTKFPTKESAKDCIEKYLFPSLTSLRQKAVFLIHIVRCLLQSYSGERKCENKNDFKNKRLDLASELLERELSSHVGHAERRVVKAMQKDMCGIRGLQPLEYYFDASIVTAGLMRAFSTGSWTHHFMRNEKVNGVVTTLKRTNPLQVICDMRKTRLQYARKAVGDARFPHPSHIGRLCFLSTPDGDSCGLVKNLAVTGLVSTNLIEPLLDKLIDCGMETLVENPTFLMLKGKDKVFLNGEWVGICVDSLSFIRALRSKRRNNEVPPQVEVKWDIQQREVRIFSDAGRILRPLLVVENLKKIKLCKGSYNIHSLLNKGIIELVGVEEEEDYMIAGGVKQLLSGDNAYNHCELDSSFLLGLSAGLIPFPNHDPARRVLYQSEKHSQQAIGFSTTNPNIRADTLSQHLHYPQRPLFHTMISDCLGKSEYMNSLPKPEMYNGQNAIVSVNVHQGYNQEDSLVMNQASVDRGLFRTEHIRNYKDEVDNTETRRAKTKERMSFCKTQKKHEGVHKLDDDGLPFLGAKLKSGDAIISKCGDAGSEKSTKLKHTEGGMVQNVILSANNEGTNFASVSLRQVRAPLVGDKFSSMHGQKGVIGLLESQENFPFTHQGLVPDIVINPHAFPSRQTIGQLLEAALGKGIACNGMTKHATPFTTPSVTEIAQQLHQAGFARWGHEKVISGLYGHMIYHLMFMGPTFYQRLLHMSEYQVKTRSVGPVNPYTRQPVKDRKRFGGMKLGEMERDCFLAHGGASFLKERLLTLSDLTPVLVCSKCSNMAILKQTQAPSGGVIGSHYCNCCESAANLVKVDMPFGAKVLSQELFGMGISLKFGTKPA
ncbi:DNA-directed RNA polymerase [Ranunculus cassubicifolius]